MESLSQYEPLNITTGDVSSHYLNSYDILHDVDGQMEVFSLNSSELLLSGYEPLNITSEDTRSHYLSMYELQTDEQKEEFQLKEFQQIIIPELTSKSLKQEIQKKVGLMMMMCSQRVMNTLTSIQLKMSECVIHIRR